MKYYITFTLLLSLILSSCGINSNIMFREEKGKEIVSDSIPMSPTSEYKLAADDKITCAVFSNKGHGLIDQTAGLNNPAGASSVTATYTIRKDGTVELPKIGTTSIAGLSIAECQAKLSALYGKEYQEPYVLVTITNQRVIVFPGGASDAKVITLFNSNTTLMEVIALAGGINERGKSAKIKLMRYENGIRKIYPIDLSKIENLKYADIVVQANDYIYIEPNKRIAKETLQIVTPIMTLTTSIFTFITIITTLKK